MARTSRDWVIAAVQVLNRAGSWTGRIHIHKLLFIADTLGLVDAPFTFELYQYGPYSRRLDRVVAELEENGELAKEFPAPGYGPKYSLAEEPSGLPLDEEDATALKKVGELLRDCDSRDLELVATCIWVEKLEKVDDDNQIAERVAQIKPRYDDSQIRTRLRKSREIAAALAE